MCEKGYYIYKYVYNNDIIYIECNPEMGSKLSFYDEECYLVTFEVIDNIPCNLKYNTIPSDELSKYVSI